ncbi:hypothetical protein SCHPADRAFT_588726 [Schizopora paradoxa]|uniref:Zn(2)-C6 fungal-type domain-containing protein n=1 Tax=Schizopora paradoxa TaxID=27342 RepID=A0A0H2RAQ9_9AGAM|nr:hypothetical protein SCHPADRAFT_588726 [Schizopora paradoxa]
MKDSVLRRIHGSPAIKYTQRMRVLFEGISAALFGFTYIRGATCPTPLQIEAILFPLFSRSNNSAIMLEHQSTGGNPAAQETAGKVKNAYPCAVCKRMHRKCHGGYPCVGCIRSRTASHRTSCEPTNLPVNRYSFLEIDFEYIDIFGN